MVAPEYAEATKHMMEAADRYIDAAAHYRRAARSAWIVTAIALILIVGTVAGW